MTADRLVILLHGVGANGLSIASLAEHLGLSAAMAVAAPDAPFAFDPAPHGPGRQWFSVAGVTPENRPARVAAARAPFDAVLAGIIADHGLSDALDRVALVGFSQGSIMALDAVATGRWPVGLLVAFSGRFVGPAPAVPPKTPILIAHGRADTAIPLAEGYHAHDCLPEAEFIVENNVGHAPGPQGMARARVLLAQWSGAALA
jgi:phospholipase/carboxylesterase